MAAATKRGAASPPTTKNGKLAVPKVAIGKARSASAKTVGSPRGAAAKTAAPTPASSPKTPGAKAAAKAPAAKAAAAPSTPRGPPSKAAAGGPPRTPRSPAQAGAASSPAAKTPGKAPGAGSPSARPAAKTVPAKSGLAAPRPGASPKSAATPKAGSMQGSPRTPRPAPGKQEAPASATAREASPPPVPELPPEQPPQGSEGDAELLGEVTTAPAFPDAPAAVPEGPVALATPSASPEVELRAATMDTSTGAVTAPPEVDTRSVCFGRSSTISAASAASARNSLEQAIVFEGVSPMPASEATPQRSAERSSVLSADPEAHSVGEASTAAPGERSWIPAMDVEAGASPQVSEVGRRPSTDRGSILSADQQSYIAQMAIEAAEKRSSIKEASPRLLSSPRGSAKSEVLPQEERVVLRMLVTNVNYDSLVANEAIASLFLDLLKEEVAASTGAAVGAGQLDVQLLRGGTMNVEVVAIFPAGATILSVDSASLCTIEVAPGTYYGPNNRNIVISGVADLTIIGTAGRQATVLDLEQQGIGISFSAASGRAHLEGLTLMNGLCSQVASAERNGAGLKFIESAATVRSVALRNMDCQTAGVEYTLWSGAAIYLKDSAAVLEDIEVSDSVANHGGGVAAWGNDRSTVRNGVFLRTGGTKWAGAMLMEDNVSTEFHHCHFSHSHCAYGAGLDDGATAHPLYKDCIFEYGEAVYGGASYHFSNSQTRWENCIFRHNVADSAAHYISANSKPDFKNCTFFNNTALQEGGAVRSQYLGIHGPMVFDRVRFLQNRAGTFGGAVTMQAAPGAVEFRDCRFEDNVAQSMGGGAVRVQGVSGPGSSDEPTLFLNIVFLRNSAYLNGGAVVIGVDATSDNQFSFHGCVFEGNSAARAGGALALTGAATLSIASSSFTQNTAGMEGGAVSIQNTQKRATEVHIVSTVIGNNTAVTMGGGLACSEGEGSPTKLVMRDFTISGATVLGNGAGMHYACTYLNTSSGTFRNNRAVDGNGGAMVLSANVACGDAANGIAFDGVAFEDNYAAVGGGLVFFDHVSPTCQMPLQHDGSLNASDTSVWRWADFAAAVRGNQASYGALQATAPAKITVDCATAAGGGLGGCAKTSQDTDTSVTYQTAYPGMAIEVALAMTDDLGQRIRGENAGAGVQVQAVLHNVAVSNSTRFVTVGVERFWFDAGTVSVSDLSVLGGVGGEAIEELQFRVPRVLVAYAYLPAARVHLSLGSCPTGHIGATAANGDGGEAYTCQACPSGQYAPRLAPRCQACDAGRFAPSSGSGNCTVCPIGHKCPPGTTTPVPCQAGQYQCTAGQLECKRCKRGSYQNADGAAGCLLCPSGTSTPYLGATVISDCVCPEGTFGNTTCTACTTGMLCPAGSQQPDQEEGFYVQLSAAGGFEAYRCLAGRCPEGQPGECAAGREGLACDKCRDGYFPVSDGACEECGGAGVLPTLLSVIALMATMSFLFFTVTKATRQIDLTELTVVILAGQTFVLVQVIASLNSLQIPWPQPFHSLMNSLKILQLNVDIVRFQCVIASDSPIVKYLFTVFLIIVLCALLALVFAVLVLATRRRPKLDNVINSFGTMIMAVYLPVTMACLMSMQCISNPNGTSALATMPSVLCGEEEHIVMLVLGILGLLCTPIPILCGVCFLVRMMPKLIAAGQGFRLLLRFKFLFQRFHPTRYHFAALYVIRNFFLAMPPVFFPDSAMMQLLLIFLLIMSFLVSECTFWPWRTELANAVEILFGSILIAFLLIATAIVEIDSEAVSAQVGIMSVIFSAVIIVAILVVLGISVRRFLAFKSSVGKEYDMFISGHASTVRLQRFLQLVAEGAAGAKVCMHSDQVAHPEYIFDIVQKRCKNVVAVLSDQALRTTECAGVLVSAFQAGVPIVLVTVPDYTGDATLDTVAVSKMWVPEELYQLHACKISIQDIEKCYAHLATLDPIKLPRMLSSRKSLECMQANVDQLLDRCGLGVQPQLLRPVVNADAADKSRACYAILANGADAEAGCAAVLLQAMIIAARGWQVSICLSPEDVRAEPRPAASVVVLTRGCLGNPAFAAVLCAARAEWTESVDILAVQADASLGFPGRREVLEVLVPDVAKVLPDVREATIAACYGSLLDQPAEPFLPDFCGRSALQIQVIGICQRLASREQGSPQEQTETTPLGSAWRASRLLGLGKAARAVRGMTVDDISKSIAAALAEESRELKVRDSVLSEGGNMDVPALSVCASRGSELGGAAPKLVLP